MWSWLQLAGYNLDQGRIIVLELVDLCPVRLSVWPVKDFVYTKQPNNKNTELGNKI